MAKIKNNWVLENSVHCGSIDIPSTTILNRTWWERLGSQHGGWTPWRIALPTGNTSHRSPVPWIAPTGPEADRAYTSCNSLSGLLFWKWFPIRLDPRQQSLGENFDQNSDRSLTTGEEGICIVWSTLTSFWFVSLCPRLSWLTLC